MIAKVGEGIDREFGKVMYTLLYSKWITKNDLLYSTWNSTQCCMPAWMGGGFEGKWIHAYVWLSSLFTETTTTLLISYTPIQNKKFEKKMFFNHSLQTALDLVFSLPLSHTTYLF